MYCPGCGSEERQRSQFCRTCGVDMRPVRTALEAPDEITAAAASARDEIGRAIAAKIKQMQSAEDLKKVTWEVLPAVSDFLRSPEEQRLELMRAGVITAAAGLGTLVLFIILNLTMEDMRLLLVAGLGLVAFLVGLALVINGKYLTVQPPKSSRSRAAELAKEPEMTLGSAATRGLAPASAEAPLPVSVTEHTTHHLLPGPPVGSRD